MSQTKTRRITTGAAVGEIASVICVDGLVTYSLLDAESFNGTIKLRYRPYRDPDGADWTGNAGYVELASHTAATDAATDELCAEFGGVWECQLYLSAYTSGSITAAIGARNAA